jgi:hypothetical protein
VHQHRLDLVVGGVADSHGLGGVFARGGKQETVAQCAGGFLDRKPIRLGAQAHVGRVDLEGQAEAASQPGNGLRLPVRLEAQPVVEVRHDDGIPGVAQDVQQAQAVGSTGNPGNDRPVGDQAALIAQHGKEALGHRNPSLTEKSPAGGDLHLLSSMRT